MLVEIISAAAAAVAVAIILDIQCERLVERRKRRPGKEGEMWRRHYEGLPPQ